MRVTAEKGKGSKIHIYADGSYVFTVDVAFWYAQGVAPDSEWDEDAFAEFRSRAEVQRTCAYALKLLSYRDYSRQELEEKLRGRAPAEAAAEALEKTAELGLLDDARYAARLVEDRFTRKGMAPPRIRQELFAKGIDTETADTALAQLAFSPQKRILELLDSKFRNLLVAFPQEDSSRDTFEKARKRTIDTFLRLGYAYSDIRSALREINLWEDEDYEL